MMFLKITQIVLLPKKTIAKKVLVNAMKTTVMKNASLNGMKTSMLNVI